MDVRPQRRLRPQQLRLHDRRHPQRVARADDAAEQDRSSTPARSALNQFVGNVDVEPRCVDAALAGPLNVAFGAEFRRENYRDRARASRTPTRRRRPRPVRRRAPRSARRSSPASVRRTKSTRRATASPATSTSKATCSRRSALGLAGRVEHYSDFGNTVDGKLTVRVRSRTELRPPRRRQHRLPRAVARAVVLLDVSTNFLNLGRGRRRRSRSARSPWTARSRGSSARRTSSRRSRCTCSGGVVLVADAASRPHDRLLPASTSTTASSSPATSRAAHRARCIAPFGANGARFFTNAIDTRTNGYDLTADLPGRPGRRARRLRLRAGYNNNETKIVGTIATPRRWPASRTCCSTASSDARIDCGQPKDNLRLTADWTRGSLGVVVAREPLRRVLLRHERGGQRPDVQPRVAGRPRVHLAPRQVHAGRRACRTSSTPSRTT